MTSAGGPVSSLAALAIRFTGNSMTALMVFLSLARTGPITTMPQDGLSRHSVNNCLSGCASLARRALFACSGKSGGAGAVFDFDNPDIWIRYRAPGQHTVDGLLACRKRKLFEPAALALLVIGGARRRPEEMKRSIKMIDDHIDSARLGGALANHRAKITLRLPPPQEGADPYIALEAHEVSVGIQFRLPAQLAQLCQQRGGDFAGFIEAAITLK